MMVKPICPRCGSDLNKKGEIYWCSNCIGWVAPNDINFKVRHKSCGHWNPKGSHLCEGCGQKLDDDYIIVAEQDRIRILSARGEVMKKHRKDEKTLVEKREEEKNEERKKEKEAQSSTFLKQFKRAIKQEKGVVTHPLPPPPTSEQRKFKSQFKCKACGRIFWVYEHRLKNSLLSRMWCTRSCSYRHSGTINGEVAPIEVQDTAKILRRNTGINVHAVQSPDTQVSF